MRKFTELALHNRKPNKTEKDGKAKWLIRWSWLERDRASEWVGGVGKDRVVEVAKRGGGGWPTHLLSGAHQFRVQCQTTKTTTPQSQSLPLPASKTKA